MKKNILFSISFVIAAFVFCLMLTQNAEALGVNIPNCTTNQTATHTIIGTSGIYYVNQTITANSIDQARVCLYINTSDVYLECRNNSQIIGMVNLTGIWTNETNVTIQNCYLSNFSDAINLSSSTNVIIYNNTLENMTNIAINVLNSNTSNFSTNIINNCTVGGINITDVNTGNTIELNTFYTTGTSINIRRGTGNSILSNTLNNGTEGIDLWNEITATILSNIIGNYSNIGIQALNSNGTNITSNTIKNITTTGIFINFSFSNDIASNTIYNATTAIYSDRSDDGFFTSNTIRNGTTGLYLVRNNNMTVTSNTARKFNMGFRFRNASNSTATLSTANNNNFGFYIDTNSDGNAFSRSTINLNANYGLLILDTLSGNNTFTGFNLSNPSATARDININAGDNKFYTIAVSYSNATFSALRTNFNFKNYNGTKMNISAVEDVLVIGDPANRQNISKYLNITRPAKSGMNINISYSSADLLISPYVSINPADLRVWNSSDSATWQFIGGTVFNVAGFVSVNLTGFSEFGLFAPTVNLPQYRGGSSSGGGGTGVAAISLDTNAEVTKNLRRLDYFKFTRKYELHKLTILNIDTITRDVTLKVESTPVVLTIKEKETGKVDVDGNGYYDLGITVEQIDTDTALLVLKRIDEKTSDAQRPTVKDQVTTPPIQKDERPPVREDYFEGVVGKEPAKKSNVFWIFIIVIAVIIVGWIIFEVTKKGKKKRR